MTLSPDSEETQEFEWDRELAFATFKTIERGGKKYCVLQNDRSPAVPPKQQYSVSTGGDSVARWEKDSDHPYNMSVGYPPTGVENISLIKRITRETIPVYLPIAAWSSTNVANWPGASPELLLQAYIVDGEDYDGVILDAGVPKHRLFPEPLKCDELPNSSAWRLIEDHDGITRLMQADVAEILAQQREAIQQKRAKADAQQQAIESLTRSFDDMKKQLETVVKSLEGTQQRLLAMEGSIGTNQAEVRETQKSLATARDEVSRLDRKQPEVAKLAASVDRTEERLVTAERSIAKNQEELRALAGARNDLPKLEASVHHTQQQLSTINTSFVTLVDQRIPTIEAKTHDLDESMGHVQDQLSAARTAANTTRDRVDRLNRGVLAVQATADLLGASVGQVQDRISAVESPSRAHPPSAREEKRGVSVPVNIGPARVADVQRQSPGIRKPSGQVQDEPSSVNESSNTTRRQLAALDRKIPLVEGRVEKLEKSLALMERKVPVTDAKVDQLDKHFGRTLEELTSMQVSLGVIKDNIAGLDSRFGEVEVKVDELLERWDRVGDGGGPPGEDSPGLFPSRDNVDHRDASWAI